MVNHPLFLPLVSFYIVSLLARASGQADTICYDTDGWEDIDGDDCSLYDDNVSNCGVAEDFANGLNVSALDACCFCGGGTTLVVCYACDGGLDQIVDHSKTTTFEGEVISCLGLQVLGIQGVESSATCEDIQSPASQDCGCSAGPAECTDKTGWVDQDNDDCSYYEWYGCEGAESFANAAGVSAFGACCICGGGIPETGAPTPSPIAAGTPSQPTLPTPVEPTMPEGDGGINPALYSLAAVALIAVFGVIFYCRRKISTSIQKKGDATKPLAEAEKAPSSLATTPTEPPRAGVRGHSGTDSANLPLNKDQCRSFATGGITETDVVVEAYPVVSPVDSHESPSHSGASSSTNRRAALDP